MDQITQLMFTQLIHAKEQIDMACYEPTTACGTDMRYFQEWEGLRDYTEVAVANIQAAAREYPVEQVQVMIAEVMQQLVPAGNALLEGYLSDLAICTDCNVVSCQLRIRAREALEARRMIKGDLE